MTLQDLLHQLRERRIALTVDAGELALRAPAGAMTAELMSALREHKPALLAMPADALRAALDQAPRITPDMLTLVTLEQAAIDALVEQVPGGAANVQDIYPLAPLQQGILFHHLLEGQGDAYLMRSIVAFDRAERRDAFLAALQQVIDRHDILRSAVHWDGLPQPVQVVQRRAPLPVTELVDTGSAPVLAQLEAATDPHAIRLDLRRAPLLAAFTAFDPATGEWLLALLRHHMVADHVTMDLVLSEIRQILQGHGDRLPVPMPYRNFIARTHATPEGEHEAFFRDQLGDIDEPTAPFGVLETQVLDERIHEARVSLDDVLAADIRDCARRCGVTPAVLFHIGWARVLAACTNRDDVVFGTVLSGRLQGSESADRVVGMFINTLPIRIPASAPDVREAVRDTHARLVALLEHEQASLALAQRCSAVTPPLPLFTTLLNYRYGRDDGASSAAAQQAWEGMRRIGGDAGTNYPLTLSVEDRGQGFGLVAQCVDVVDPGHVVSWMATAMRGLVDALARTPTASLARIGVLTPNEREYLQVTLNATQAPYPHERLIHQLIEDQAAQRPLAPAVVFEDQTLGYAELNQRANRVAHRLLALGLKPDDRVAICVERGPDMVVGLLGILKAGGAYVPLDPAYPTERLTYMVQDSAPVAALTQQPLHDKVQALDDTVPVLALDDAQIWSSMPDRDPQASALGLHARHLAYVIYTSGSTGRPKGAMVEHRGLCNLATAQRGLFGVTPHSRVLQFASFSFDASIFEMVMALCSGACLVLAPREALRPGEPLRDTLLQQRITHATLPSSALAALPVEPWDGPATLTFVIAGEAFPPELARRWMGRARIFNAYGPTETTVCATAHEITALAADARSVPIGRPIANTTIHLLDAHGELVPPGVPGEIHIGGAGVARGYLHRHELSAERFLPDPYADDADARLYRTGDLARWRADGTLDFIGRTDFQVKVRGFRIEPGEVEACLASCTGVREAAVIVRQDVPGDARLVAYVVPESGIELEPAALRAALATQLAEHMIPSAIVLLVALPLTPNGKLDRKALPAPDRAALATREYVPAQDESEQTLAAIWQDLLGVERVGRFDHFFELGGHSLLAMQVVVRLRERSGRKLALREVFAKPVLADLAALLRGDAIRDERLPLTWSQQRLWFRDRIGEAEPARHAPQGLRLDGELDRDVLQAAWVAFHDRHPVLRSRFDLTDDGPVRWTPASAGAIPVWQDHDLRRLPPDARQAALHALAEAQSESRFDLAGGDLLRAALVRMDDRTHVLLWTQHAIAGSPRGLLDDLVAVHAATVRGQSVPALPDASQAHQAPADFWRQHLADAPALLELPTDRPRPPVQAQHAARIDVPMAASLLATLEAIARTHATDVETALMAAWSLLLARLSGQDDVVLGVETAGGLQPIRIRVDEGTRVAGLVKGLVATCTLAAQHPAGFDALLATLQPERSFGHHPLFQAGLRVERETAHAAGGMQWSPQPLPTLASPLDLSLVLRMQDAAPSLHLEYATALFDAATVARWADHLAVLVEAMAGDAARHVLRLPLLRPAERTHLLADFNDTARDFPRDSTIVARFEEQVRRDPHAPALEDGRVSLSYAELDRRANRLAHRLLALGVQPDQFVALCGERSVAFVVGMLAVLKAGAAYLPLDPTHPAERLAYMLADSAAVAMLVDEAAMPGAEALRSHGFLAPVLPLDIAEATGDGQADAAPGLPGLRADHLCYLIYTSGSTGQPKGVMVEHRHVLRLVVNSDYAPVGPGDCMSHNANPAFDASTWEVWAPLLNGARVRVIDRATVLDAQAFNQALIDGGVNVLWLTIGLFNQYAETLAPAFARLRHLLVGGDVMDPRVARRAMENGLSPGVLRNVYGPTESTTYTTAYPIPGIVDGQPVPIGRPISNTRTYVLDRFGEPVPVGVTGELYVGGDGVARGYLNRADLTAQRFLPDPFDPRPGARMYRSGDLVRWRADGNIDFVGRNDHQVKLRGFRIELGEIETRLAACEGVQEAVVLLREDVAGDRRLVAYVVPRAQAAVDVAMLHAALSRELADYMVPSAFVRLPALPLTPNGKLDRRALPAPDGDAVVARAYAVPEGEIEQAIAQAWQALLGLERVGRFDHFFELGGHSLLAVQLVAQLRETLGVELPLRELFAQPTLEAMARACRGSTRAALPPIIPVDRDGPLPLSWAQQRLWFLDQLDAAAGAAYHMPSALRLQGRLRADVLRATLDRVVARHENLRTCFVMRDGEPQQSIAPADIGFDLIDHDLGALDPHAQAEAVAELSTQEARASFDLARGPLFRGRLLRLSDDEHVLLLTQHHIISDGWSMGLLTREVVALYTAFCEGRPDPLPPLDVQYADYAAWQRRWLQGDALREQVDFWRSHLAGAPAMLELPTDHVRPPVQSYAGERVSLRIPADLTTQLREFSRRRGATIYMTLLAAWSLLMSRLSGQDDIVTGTPLANRQHSKVESLLGFFVNTLALRVKLDENPTVAELVEQVRTTTLEAYAHQDLPFEQVVEALAPERSLAYSPVFQTVFSLNNTPGRGTMDLPGLQLSPVEARRHTAHYDLDLALGDNGDTLSGNFAYASRLFERATVERFGTYFLALLRAMVADDTRRIGELDWITEAERAQVVTQFNATDAPYPHDRLVHELFQEQAALRPDAPAVVFEDETLDYAELNRRANRVAHRLIALGVKPDDRVAICVERGLDMVVGLLGILKAGGAYVPLDPAYPLERLGYMIGDSAPVAVLTQQHLREQVPVLSAGVPVLALDDAQAWARMPDGNPDPTARGLTPRHLAYVIYTSGSTGRPKGAMVEHRGVCNLATAQIALFDVQPASRVLQFASFSFDASISEVVMTLCRGACLVLASREALRPGEPLRDTLDRQRVTHVTLPPSILAALNDHPPASRDLTLVLAGEALPPAQARQWATRARLLNAYGPTEATVCASVQAVGDVAADAHHVPIGAPIPNVRIHLLDRWGQPVPVGVRGELYIGGVGVARGYLGRPDLTAERFIADPFSDQPGARLYRTGDLARWRPDGTLEYLGRNDFQVKLRGFRIELGEIEARLAACPGVRESAVLALHAAAGARLVAYVVPHPGVELSAGSLREALSRELADYMLPSAFVLLDALPLTPNGKLDRRALPAPDQAAVAAREYAAPEGEVEQAIAQVWQELLAVPRVGRFDHFFELGGHSLLATRVVIRLKEALQVELELRDLFSAPQLDQLAQVIAQRQLAQFDESELLAVLAQLQDEGVTG